VRRVKQLPFALVALVISACGPDVDATGALRQALPSTSVVISQYYGAGGTTGQPMAPVYRTDFVELHNVSGQSVALGTLTLQYAAVLGMNWIVSDFDPAASIPAGGFHLIAFRAGQTTIGAPLPNPDTTNVTQDLGRAEFKLALVDGVAPLTGLCPLTGPDATRIIDFVGAGAANCAEGGADGGAAPAASIVTGLLRKQQGCQDTDRNVDDFEALTPVARSSASPVVLCLGDGGTLVVDAGAAPVDAGVADAGRPIDAGSVIDAGRPDAGVAMPDAGSTPVDAGTQPLVDAGRADAGTSTPDAGTTPSYTARTGCKCSSTDASTLLLVVALVGLRRRIKSN
jgi:hypothetical protein